MFPDEISAAVSDFRPPNELTDVELDAATVAFNRLIELAHAGTERFEQRRCTLVAEADQLDAEFRNLQGAVATTLCSGADRTAGGGEVAKRLAAHHLARQTQLTRWEELEKNQRDLSTVLRAAAGRSAALAAEVRLRRGESS